MYNHWLLGKYGDLFITYQQETAVKWKFPVKNILRCDSTGLIFLSEFWKQCNIYSMSQTIAGPGIFFLVMC